MSEPNWKAPADAVRAERVHPGAVLVHVKLLSGPADAARFDAQAKQHIDAKLSQAADSGLAADVEAYLNLAAAARATRERIGRSEARRRELTAERSCLPFQAGGDLGRRLASNAEEAGRLVDEERQARLELDALEARLRAVKEYAERGANDLARLVANAAATEARAELAALVESLPRRMATILERVALLSSVLSLEGTAHGLAYGLLERLTQERVQAHAGAEAQEPAAAP